MSTPNYTIVKNIPGTISDGINEIGDLHKKLTCKKRIYPNFNIVRKKDPFYKFFKVRCAVRYIH